MAEPNPRVDWFFGRGLSMGCNLNWSVPQCWRHLSRDVQIARIKTKLRAEMDASSVDISDINKLLHVLKTNTVSPWRHLFLTTNWDYLLQRQILALGHTVLPAWAAEMHVYHLNGTVEILLNNVNRSPFLLETDPTEQRTFTVEAEKAFHKIIYNKTFVVVGMSFECETDKFLLRSLASVQDELPIGESQWIVINPDSSALKDAKKRITGALPHCTVQTVNTTFRSWLDANAPDLQTCGALSFQPFTTAYKSLSQYSMKKKLLTP